MTGEHPRGVLDTNILISRRWINPADLPDEMAITAVTLAELSAGVHLVPLDDGAERARRLDILQRAEADFDPLPFDAGAARLYGQASAVLKDLGRTPRRRVADLMIAATAAAHGLPLYTTNPVDFAGLSHLTPVISVLPPDIR
ncbi:MAG: type II toxin-antitoxin system VapC family toxin [Bifidobacteriaceae bacterium]|jgi:predicted nucleic acid-binding protein|nr:type II toxin-antitoxin system VapC family toxin [Bifidobacteriaceae bacterium]